MISIVLGHSRLSPHWLALFVVLAGVTLPDCCLNGHHLLGPGMETFGPICRASF